MVYSNHFVLCILVNGKPQSERKDGIIPIPLGSEYSLRLRNKNSRRSLVKFSIDGEDVSGPGYIIPAHSAIDIHRHFDKDRCFKFVSIDSPEAIDHGKNDNSDGSKGVIQARFYLEKAHYTPPCKWPTEEHHHHHHYYPPSSPVILPHPTPWPHPYTTWCGNSNPGSLLRTCSNSPEASGSWSNKAASDVWPNLSNPVGTASNMSFNEGCTIEGGSTGQTFREEWFDSESDFVTIRLVLKGIDNACPVVVSSSSEEYCTRCGARRARKADRFCGACGNKL